MEIMEYDAWEAWHEDEIGCLHGRWLFETNGEGDYEDYCNELYDEYVRKAWNSIEIVKKEGA